MKKIVALIMAIVLCLSLCACSKAYPLGETVEVNGFTYKITDVQIADSTSLDDATSDNFFSPSDNSEKKFTAPGGSALLCFTAEYTYTGSTVEDSDIAKDVFAPSVKCKGGKFDSNYMVFMREKGGTWYSLTSDLSWETRVAQGIDYDSLSFDLKPGGSTVYEVRGCIYIPTAAAQNENSKITLSLSGTAFSVR